MLHVSAIVGKIIGLLHILLGFPSGSAGKESACNARDLGLIPGLGRPPGVGKGYPLQYSGLEEFHGLYSPWGRKESDTTERLSLSHILLLNLRNYLLFERGIVILILFMRKQII